MTVDNIRVPVADRGRDAVLKEKSEEGYTLVAVTLDGWKDERGGRTNYWSMYFTKEMHE